MKLLIVDTMHISGENNWRAYMLSRGKRVSELRCRGKGFENTMDVQMEGKEIVELCDPKVRLTTEGEFLAYWMRVDGNTSSSECDVRSLKSG